MNAARVPAAGDALAPDEPGGFKAWFRANSFAILLLAPTVIILLALTIFPLIYSVYVSLFDFYLPRPHRRAFVGLENYGTVLTDARFWASMRITGIFMFFSISIQFILGTALAVFFFDEFRGRSAKAIYLPLILVPMMIAPVRRRLRLAAALPGGVRAAQLHAAPDRVVAPRVHRERRYRAPFHRRGRHLAMDPLRHPGHAGRAGRAAPGALRGNGNGWRQHLAAAALRNAAPAHEGHRHHPC